MKRLTAMLMVLLLCLGMLPMAALAQEDEAVVVGDGGKGLGALLTAEPETPETPAEPEIPELPAEELLPVPTEEPAPPEEPDLPAAEETPTEEAAPAEAPVVLEEAPAADGEYMDCPDGGHVASPEWHGANYTDCSGGYKTDGWWCMNCWHIVDSNGYALEYFEAEALHSPGSYQYSRDYVSCEGGYTEDFYLCTKCHSPVNAEGTAYVEWAEGDGQHQPSSVVEKSVTACGGGYTAGSAECRLCHNTVCVDESSWVDGNGQHSRSAAPVEHRYTACGGGIVGSYYECTVCWTVLDASGAELGDEDIDHRWPSARHTPGSTLRNNFSPCGGGLPEGYYECTVCRQGVYADGREISYWVRGNGQHTPDTSYFYEADYSECGGGIRVEHYDCTGCGRTVDAAGQPVAYEMGSGQHTPDTSECYPADYSECNGGFRVEHYECTGCRRPVDINGQPVEYEEGTGRHTPDLENEQKSDYSSCGGGIPGVYYYCTGCRATVYADGSLAEYQESEGGHTPILSDKYDKSYTACGGGYPEDYYFCSVCGQQCYADGSDVEYLMPTEDHSPGGLLYPADYNDCEGGYTEAYYICTVCEQPTTAAGKNPAWLPAGDVSHLLQLVPGKAPSFTGVGNIAYWKCTECGDCFKDKEGECYTWEEDCLLPQLEESTTRTDETSGIFVSAPYGDFEGVVSLLVTPLTAGDYAEALGNGKMAAYDISLRDENGDEVDVYEWITVVIPVPAGMSGALCSVYHDAGGSLEEMDVSFDAQTNSLIFRTWSFSPYIVSESAVLLGDADGNGKVNARDATVVLRFDARVIGETALNMAAADVDGNGKVNARDATYILRKDAGVITQFPAEK